MGLLSNILSGGIDGIVSSVGGVIDRFVQTDDEKAQMRLEVEKILTDRFKTMEASAIATVKSRMEVIVAELQHGDTYVKRTRPMIARWGLYLIIYNYAAVPTLSGAIKFLIAAVGIFMTDPGPIMNLMGMIQLAPFDLPTEFWVAWGGIVGTYAVGRSFEKMGVRNRMTQAATGSATPEQIADRILQG